MELANAKPDVQPYQEVNQIRSSQCAGNEKLLGSALSVTASFQTGITVLFFTDKPFSGFTTTDGKIPRTQDVTYSSG